MDKQMKNVVALLFVGFFRLLPSYHMLALLAFLIFVSISPMPTAAQEVTGELGSPDATTTIEGNQIPAPPGKFGAQCAADHDR
jgi:hypothetical protein